MYEFSLKYFNMLLNNTISVSEKSDQPQIDFAPGDVRASRRFVHDW